MGLPNMTEKVTMSPFDKIPIEDNQFYGGNEWWKQEMCAQKCSGANFMQCPPGMSNFDEPASGISGYLGNFLYMNEGSIGAEGFPFSIMDEVKVPSHFEEGEYLLSWRWDCEQSPQIWQQCADIRLVKKSSEISV